MTDQYKNETLAETAFLIGSDVKLKAILYTGFVKNKFIKDKVMMYEFYKFLYTEARLKMTNDKDYNIDCYIEQILKDRKKFKIIVKNFFILQINLLEWKTKKS